MIAVETTAANCHDSKPLLTLLDKAGTKPGTRVYADKAYCSQTRWFGSKVLRYCGNASVHAWHILQAMAYNLKRLPKLYAGKQMQA